MTTADAQILIIGFGSTLRGDDALGRVACERLRALLPSPRVKVIDQTAPTPELAAQIAEARLVVFLDASVDGTPDTVVVRPTTRKMAQQGFAHSMTPAMLIELAEHLYAVRPRGYIVSFRGKSFEINGGGLSNEADAACDDMVRQTLQIIGREQCLDRKGTSSISGGQ